MNEAMKKSLAGNFGIGVFVIALVTVALAFGTSSWLVRDSQIRGPGLDRLGLWSYCYRWLYDPYDQNLFLVKCRWVYSPLTTEYYRIRHYLQPSFMIPTQFFFTLCLLGVLISTILLLILFLRWGPDQNRYVTLIKSIGYITLISGICGAVAVIEFAIYYPIIGTPIIGNDGWIHHILNNYLGWSFGLGVVGSVACIVGAALFLTEGNIQARKRNDSRESQARCDMENETKV